MEHATLILLEIAFGITIAGGLAGYAVYAIKRPKSFFRVWTPDGGELSYKLKKLGSTFTWTDPADKRKVVWPLKTQFARRAKNGGLRFTGNPKTGALIVWDGAKAAYVDVPEGEEAPADAVVKGELVAWTHQPNAWHYTDPKYGPAALNDGRVLQIARAMKGDPAWAQYIPIVLIAGGIILMALLFMVYKMYSRASTGG